MKARYIAALSMLAGMAVGAVAIQALHAQARSPVYMIALDEITDADRYSNEYLRPAQASIKLHGGVYVAAGPGTLIEGTLPKESVVVLRWDSMEALKAWRESSDYLAARQIGIRYGKYNIVAVKGVSQ
jgi:uncharacterized protein (DUF1330 family)